MVKVIFYNLLRSKYRIEELDVKPGTIFEIITQITHINKDIDIKDFETCIVFVDGRPVHFRNFDSLIEDNKRIIFTHFVGGG